MANHEFQAHERINELLKQIGVPNTRDLAPLLAEYLETSKIPFNPSSIPISQSIGKIMTNCPMMANDFKLRYAELKERHCRDLDTFVYFLSEICDKPDIKQMLAPKSIGNLSTIMQDTTFNTMVHSTSTPSVLGSTKLSSTQLADLREKVLKTTQSNVVPITPNILNSISKFTIHDKYISRAKKETTNFPEYPNWVHDRLHLSWDFYPNAEKIDSEADATKMSVSIQEEQLVDDLLNCMIGIEGKFIKTSSLIDKHSERSFNIDRSLDPAMRELAKRIIPVCTNYSLIMRFVEEKSQFKWGLVNQALCSAIRELLKNHFVFVCQLENLQRKGSLSMQKLWYYVNPIMAFMEILASIIKVINKGDCCGSSVINILCDKINFYSGDPKIQELIVYLAQTATKPYLSMLEEWIYKGQLNDPYNEFMIVENKDKPKYEKGDEECLNEKFWWKKYTINDNNIPKFLEPLKTKILLTGKYLNAIHETGKFLVVDSNQIVSEDEILIDDDEGLKRTNSGERLRLTASKKLVIPNAVEINFTTKEDVYKNIVDNAYNYSSEVLLNLLLKEHKLMDRLRSLKHYFLLDQSDFMVHFMDIAEDEIQKNYKDIRLNKLESLLEISLRITSANSDPFKDDLRVKLFTNDLRTMLLKVQSYETQFETAKTEISKEKLTGLSVFSLDYVIKWPISLIINKRTLSKYQILFRHIFFIKHVERILCNVWLCTKSGELCLGRTNRLYALSCALKQRMLNFVQNLLNYMTFEVIESHWMELEEQMTKVTNVDNVIEHHVKFLDACMRDCMISSEQFNDIHKILSMCVNFSEYVQALTRDTKMKEETAKLDAKTGPRKTPEQRKIALQEITEDLNKIVNAEFFMKTITDYDKSFSNALLNLLDKIMNQMSNSLGETKIANVLYRLDFNDHYREQLDRLRQEQQSKETINDTNGGMDPLETF